MKGHRVSGRGRPREERTRPVERQLSFAPERADDAGSGTDADRRLRPDTRGEVGLGASEPVPAAITGSLRHAVAMSVVPWPYR